MRALRLNAIGYFGIHIATTVGVCLVTPTWEAVLCGVLLWGLRSFGVTAGYHRLFAHHSYQTPRFMRFLMACLAQTTLQGGVIDWVRVHVHHHVVTDTAEDIHSPVGKHWLRALWDIHFGWILKLDITQYPPCERLEEHWELRWLNKLSWLPALLLLLAVGYFLGWSGVVWGFLVSTVVIWHITHSINSVSHMWGKRPHATEDNSRNNGSLLAILTLGESWHNSHHAHAGTCRQGDNWRHVDLTLYVLAFLSLISFRYIVWDIKKPRARSHAK